MYVNLTASINPKGEINKELEAILKEKIPDFDTSSFMDEDEDENGKFATFYHGNDTEGLKMFERQVLVKFNS